VGGGESPLMVLKLELRGAVQRYDLNQRVHGVKKSAVERRRHLLERCLSGLLKAWKMRTIQKPGGGANHSKFHATCTNHLSIGDMVQREGKVLGTNPAARWRREESASDLKEQENRGSGTSPRGSCE